MNSESFSGSKGDRRKAVFLLAFTQHGILLIKYEVIKSELKYFTQAASLGFQFKKPFVNASVFSIFAVVIPTFKFDSCHFFQLLF